MANLVEVKVPDIGDFKDVAVIEVMVQVGETIAVDTGLVMVESDKASMEIPSTHAGVVKEIKVKVNDKVGEGAGPAPPRHASTRHASTGQDRSQRGPGGSYPQCRQLQRQGRSGMRCA